jgi:hypothetical protein
MTSDYIYNHVLGDRERGLVSIYLMNGKTFKYIYGRYGLSIRYIRNNIWPYILNIKPIELGYKNTAYYEDEMKYGFTVLQYNINEFSEKELLAHTDYELKNKAYYEYT